MYVRCTNTYHTPTIVAFCPFFNFRDKEPTKDRPVIDDEFNALLMKLTVKETKTSNAKEGKQRPQKDAGIHLVYLVIIFDAIRMDGRAVQLY